MICRCLHMCSRRNKLPHSVSCAVYVSHTNLLCAIKNLTPKEVVLGIDLLSILKSCKNTHMHRRPTNGCLQSSNWEPTFKNSCQPRFVQVVRHGTSVWRRKKKKKCLYKVANTLLWVIGIMTSVMGIYLDKGNLEYISVIKGKFVQKQLYVFFKVILNTTFFQNALNLVSLNLMHSPEPVLV